MLPNLFRIGRGEDYGRRCAMAEAHGLRGVLPERSHADVDWLIHAALAALDSCSDGVWNSGTGTGDRLAHVLAAATAHFVFSHHYAVADRHHPFGELHFLELPGAGSGVFAARRPILVVLLSEIPEEELPRHQRGQTIGRAGSRRQMAKDTPGATLGVE